jgi:hypothetical protein
MAVDVFFWYVLPLAIAAGAFGWIAYDRSRDRQRLHPGE